MASACIRSNILNTHRTNNNNNSNNNLTLPSIQNNQNFIIISQSNFNQITQQSQQQMPVQKLKNLTTIAPAPSSPPTTNSILGMNSINIQSNQCNNIQQSNNCGISGSSMNGSGNIGSYKKKFTYANIPYGTELPPSVARRNARERNRVKQVNNGYANLRQHIPQTIITALTNGGRGASKKLSKVDTLRLAVEYIRRLQDVLVDDGASDNGSDGGSLYNSGSSILSSGTDCEGSPQSTTYYHNVESPINDNNNHRLHQQQQYINHNGQLRTASGNNDYLLNQIGYSDPSVSPAPSYTSEVSIGSDHKFEYLTTQQQTNLEQQHNQQLHNNHNHNQNNVQFKFEPYDNSYNSITDTTQEDEELLDYISSWQDQ